MTISPLKVSNLLVSCALEKSYSVQQPSICVCLSDNEIRINLPGNSCRQPAVRHVF